MPSPGRRRWLKRGLIAVAVVLVAIVTAAAVLVLHSPHNVSHPNVEFTHPTTTNPPPVEAKPQPVAAPFEWPRYGYDAARNRYFQDHGKLHPPLRKGWTFADYGLLEFPPVMYGNMLYQVDDYGSAKELDKRTGRKIWETKVGTLAAASPALGVEQQLIFVPILSVHGHSPGGGAIDALSMKTGRIVWSRPIPSGTESSPLAWGNNVYFGDQSGTVYSRRANDGHLNWTYQASGSVKGGPSLSRGLLYFGDYAGRAYALNANTGHEAWAVGTSGTRFGFGSGNFYSTAAIAFGRVYMGNTDGRVYSFAERSGQLAWATGTGAYVYASPAVANVPGLGPTVYIGSYDGNFYALDAQSGAIRWSHPAGGRISGSATIIGNVVYYSTLGSRTTTGLDTRTGRVVFLFHDGAFNPVIADNGAIYLSGYETLYQFLPKRG
jgi:outer membrane protein assembly factor BamB